VDHGRDEIRQKNQGKKMKGLSHERLESGQMRIGALLEIGQRMVRVLDWPLLVRRFITRSDDDYIC